DRGPGARTFAHGHRRPLLHRHRHPAFGGACGAPPRRRGNSRRSRGALRRARHCFRQQGGATSQGRRADRRHFTQRPMKRTAIAIKRAYEPAEKADGMRIFVDRLWPRGLSKASFKYDTWPKDIAPSNTLRKWYGHDPKRFAEFGRRYRAELAAHAGAIGELRAAIKGR